MHEFSYIQSIPWCIHIEFKSPCVWIEVGLLFANFISSFFFFTRVLNNILSHISKHRHFITTTISSSYEYYSVCNGVYLTYRLSRYDCMAPFKMHNIIQMCENFYLHNYKMVNVRMRLHCELVLSFFEHENVTPEFLCSNMRFGWLSVGRKDITKHKHKTIEHMFLISA